MTWAGVLGGGPWGVSLARAARRAGADVVLATRREQGGDLDGIRVTATLRDLADCRLILIAVPSHLAREAARELGDHLDGSHLLVHGSRGLVGRRLQSISEILREETPARRVGALGGPVQATDLAKGRPSAMVVGSAYPEVARAVRDTLSSDRLQVHTTSDLLGMEWSSALMGCLAIGVGFAQQASATPGLLAALICAAVAEAAQIGAAAGAEERTLYGLAGYGDLLASMALPDRPEVVLGRALARGLGLAEAQAEARLRIEAVDLVPRITRFAQRQGVKGQMFTALGWILEGAPAPDIVRRLFPSPRDAASPSAQAIGRFGGELD